MLEQDMAARIRAAIEEELGSFRAFADLPATELEAMAERITRVIAPLVAPVVAPLVAQPAAPSGGRAETRLGKSRAA